MDKFHYVQMADKMSPYQTYGVTKEEFLVAHALICLKLNNLRQKFLSINLDCKKFEWFSFYFMIKQKKIFNQIINSF